jgi:TatD DNase family protein
MLRLFDTHVHLDASPLGERLADEVRQARQAGVRGFVVPGVVRAGWPAVLAAVRRVEGAWAAPGLHPLAAGEWDAEAQQALRRLLADPKVVAVGEIGLDALLEVPLEVQETAFRAQLRLAVAAGRPVLIHCRQATQWLLAILREEGAARVGGILHAFSGSVETARAGVRLGFAVGIGGPVTWPNARRVVEVVRQVPAEWLVLETDAPDLSPAPHRGEPNRPAFLPLIAGKVAEIRGWSLEETARITTENAGRVLKIS